MKRSNVNLTKTELPEVRRERLPAVAPGAAVWLGASAIGIYLTEQTTWPVAAQLAPLVTMVLAGGGFWLTSATVSPRVLSHSDSVHVDAAQIA